MRVTVDLFRRSSGRVIGASLFGLCLGLVLLAAGPNSIARAQSPTRLTLVQSDANRIVLELEVENYTTREQRADGAIYAVLVVPGFGYTGERGKPQLPVKGTFVGIPPGAQPTLKIIADESRSDTLARPPIPVPTARISTDPTSRLPRDLGKIVIPDAATYSANRNYPAEVARITSVSDWRSQHFAVVQFYPFQYNPATRQLIFHRRVRVEIALSYPRGMSPQTLGGALNEGSFEAVLQRTLINYDSAKNWRAKTAPRLPARRSPAQVGPGPWYKIAVNADGIYQVTCPALQSAGFNPAGINPSTLQILKQGTELAISVTGAWNGSCASSDYIEFFGQAANTKYTNTNVYWLTYGSSPGKRMAPRNGSGAGSASTAFTNTIHLEQNLRYESGYPVGVEGYDHWFWNAVSRQYGVPFQDYPVQIDYLATGNFSATLQVDLVGFWIGFPPPPPHADHYYQIYINGNLIGDMTWDGPVEQRTTFSFPQSYLNVGANTIRVSEPNAVANEAILVNYFDLNYTRPLTAITDTLRFRQAATGPWQYQITGFSSPTIETFEITDPFNVAQITPTVILGSSPYTLQFADASAPPREYIALAMAQRKTPTITKYTEAGWLSNGADYIIISHGSFTSTVQPLATLRSAKVVDVQWVYDEFNDGVLDPQAIRDFLVYAYNNWNSHFVLLVGDGTYDPKGYCAPDVCGNSTLIPPFLRMVDPWLGEVASDNRFVAFNDGTGNTLPQMFIGRLPANNVSEASAMVNKILTYEQNPPAGVWRSTVSFVADSDNFEEFWSASEDIYNDPLYTPISLAKERIYYNVCSSCSPPYPTYPSAQAAEDAINAAINAGRLIVNYVGHGGYTQWSNFPGIFGAADVSGLTNGNKLPVMLEMTCYTGYFDNPVPIYSSLAEVNVRATGKGAVASWAPSGWGLVPGHTLLHKGFLDAVMNQGEHRLGPAASYGKSYLMANSSGYEDLIDTYTLFGDPASRLQIQFQNNRFFLPFIRRQ